MENKVEITVTPQVIVDSHVREVVEVVVNIWLVLAASVAGFFTNSLVMAIFARQGLKDSVSISLAAIACVDMIVSVTSCGHRLYGIVEFFDPALAYSWNRVCGSVLLRTNLVFSIVSGCFASYVAVERCVCVIFPFGVKRHFTPLRTLIAMVTIALTIFGSMMIKYASAAIYTVFSTEFNKTIVTTGRARYPKHTLELIDSYYYIISMVWPFLSFIISLVCTIVIIVKLRQSSRFRASFQTSHGAKVQLSLKDTKVARMLLVVIIVSLIAISPRLVSYTLRVADKRIDYGMQEENLFWVILYVVYFVNALNAFVNFFIYLRMSTSFRETFLDMFYKNQVGMGQKRKLK